MTAAALYLAAVAALVAAGRRLTCATCHRPRHRWYTFAASERCPTCRGPIRSRGTE